MYHKQKICLNSRSSHQSCFIEKAVLKSFRILTGKHLRGSLFLIGLQAWRPAIVLKKTPIMVLCCKYCGYTFINRNKNVVVLLFVLSVLRIDHYFTEKELAWRIIDLTKRRYEVLKKAINLANGNDDVDDVFTDVNCRLKVVFKDQRSSFFNDIDDLKNLLEDRIS